MIGAEYVLLVSLAEFVGVVSSVGHGCGCMHDVHSQRRTLHDWAREKKTPMSSGNTLQFLARAWSSVFFTA